MDDCGVGRGAREGRLQRSGEIDPVEAEDDVGPAQDFGCLRRGEDRRRAGV